MSDFFDIKGDVEALVEAFGGSGEVSFRPVERVALHQGQSAEVLVDDRGIGVFGQCHPTIAEAFDISVPVYFAELDLGALAVGIMPQYTAISRFPATSRDLAVVVPDEVSAGEVLKEIHDHCGKLLKDVGLFDNYQGSGIEPGTKSLAFGLIFQSDEASLGAGEVDTILNELLSRLSERFGAQLRV